MVIAEIRSIFVNIDNSRPGSLAGKMTMSEAVACGSEGDKWCYTQLAFQGSIFNDDCIPTFTYAGRQEILGCWYDNSNSVFNRIKNAIDSGSITHLVFWRSVLNVIVTGCEIVTGDIISIRDVIQKLMIDYPNNIHVVPDYTNTCAYLKHIGMDTAIVPVCSSEMEIIGTGIKTDDFGGTIKINSYINSDTVSITIRTPWGETLTQNISSGTILKFTEPYTIYNIEIGSIFNLATRFVRFTSCYAKSEPSGCIPEWICDEANDGWESDGCGYTRYNVRCDPTVEIPVEYKPSDTGKVLLAGGALALALMMMNSNK